MLKEKLMEDLKQAMKDKDTVKKNTVQMTRAAILQIEKDEKKELSDDEILTIISKEVKKRKDSVIEFEKANRDDLVEQTNEEIKVLLVYLPKQLSKDELKVILSDIIKETGATTVKEMGMVMKAAKEKVGATAEGRMINEVVKELLQ